MNYYCYLYLDENGNAYYVGKGVGRRVKHKFNRSKPLPKPELIQMFYFATEWESFECEIELIAFFGRNQDGGQLDNVCLGGSGTPGYVMPEEVKRKIGDANRGRPCSAKQKKQISRKLKGRKLPPETCAKMSASRKGKKRSADQCRRMSEALKKSWAKRKAA